MSCDARLIAVQAKVDSLRKAEGDKGLDVMADCATELKTVLKVLVEHGRKDKRSVERIEALGGAVLENVDCRITVGLILRADAEAVMSQILRIAADLDAVRASSATDLIKNSIAREQKNASAKREESAMTPLAKLRGVLEQIREPTQLMPGSKRVLELVKEAHLQAPQSKKVTDGLLKSVVALSTKVLRMRSAWTTSPGAAEAGKELAAQIDSNGMQLVKVMQATWEPPFLPQVELVLTLHAEAMCTQKLALVEAALGNNRPQEAFDHLEALRPWWPYLKDVGSASLQLVGVFSKVQTFATKSFMEATEKGDAATGEKIKAFAIAFDGSRERFAGLPPMAGGSLVENLAVGEVRIAAMKHLSILDTEVAKASDGGDSTKLSLAASVQALESLTAVWSAASKFDELRDHLGSTCDALEAWVSNTAAKCTAGKVSHLVKFSEEYDARRVNLVPPAPKQGQLAPRIALIATDAHLSAAEAELAKPGALNQAALLARLQASSALVIRVGASSALGAWEERRRLAACMEATEQRALKAFSSFVLVGESRGEQQLLEFAGGYDEVWTRAGAAGATLSQRLEGERERLTKEHFARALSLVEGDAHTLDLASLHKDLRTLEFLASKLPEGSPLLHDHKTLVPALWKSLQKVTADAVESGDAARAAEAFSVGEDLVALAAAARSIEVEEQATKLLDTLREQCGRAHVQAAKMALARPGALDLDELELSFASVLAIYKASGGSEETRTAAASVVAGLSAPLTDVLLARRRGEVPGRAGLPLLVVPYGVLGLDSTGHRAAPAPDAETAVLDPAGLNFVLGGGPAGAAGAAAAMYRWLGIAGDAAFPAPVRAAITEPLLAKFHAYGGAGEKKCIHVVGPDFRTKAYTREEATDELAQAYCNILAEFYVSGMPRLRMLPVSGGIFSGPFRDELPALTAVALERAFKRLGGAERAFLAAAKIEMCIFVGEQVAAFKRAFEGTDEGADEAVLRVAAAADAALSALEGRAASSPSTAATSSVQQALEAVRLLDELGADVRKASGMRPRAVIEKLRSLAKVYPVVGASTAFRDGVDAALAQFLSKQELACRSATAETATADASKAAAAVEALMNLAKEGDEVSKQLSEVSKGLEVPLTPLSFHASLVRIVIDARLKKVEAELQKDKALNPNAVLMALKEVAPLWPLIGSVDGMDPAFDEVHNLQDRLQAAHGRVAARMGESMASATAAKNTDKQQALLKFAAAFDAICRDEVLLPDCRSLSEDLKAKIDSRG